MCFTQPHLTTSKRVESKIGFKYSKAINIDINHTRMTI